MSNGFSLIELLITLSIMGILASISVPLYQKHLITSRRRHAIVSLGQLTTRLEHAYSITHSYQSTSLQPEKYNTAYYHFKITSKQSNHYIVEAIPQSKQAEHDLCGILSINTQGIRTANKELAQCWK